MTAMTLDDLLTHYRDFSAPALLKSDTDGFEDLVLRGAHTTLTAGPVLFLEYDPRLLRAAGSDGLEMLSRLRSHGYERIAFYDKFGVLMVRCSLGDEDVIRDLHAYAAANAERNVDHYDVVLTTPALAVVIDRLTVTP
jgi:hypothetical protein